MMIKEKRVCAVDGKEFMKLAGIPPDEFNKWKLESARVDDSSTLFVVITQESYRPLDWS